MTCCVVWEGPYPAAESSHLQPEPVAGIELGSHLHMVFFWHDMIPPGPPAPGPAGGGGGGGGGGGVGGGVARPYNVLVNVS